MKHVNHILLRVDTHFSQTTGEVKTAQLKTGEEEKQHCNYQASKTLALKIIVPRSGLHLSLVLALNLQLYCLTVISDSVAKVRAATWDIRANKRVKWGGKTRQFEEYVDSPA